MTEQDKIEAKHRILNTAINLFAQKGFAAIGVREIAKEAGVNIAMISYYFNGKVGILENIIITFFDKYMSVFGDVDNPDVPAETAARQLISNIIDFVKDNTNLVMVVYNELPLDVPELSQTKAQKVSQIITRLSGLFSRLGLDPTDIGTITIIGPSLISSILTSFRFRHVISMMNEFEADEAYFNRYKETISTIFLHGVTGLAEKQKESK